MAEQEDTEDVSGARVLSIQSHVVSGSVGNSAAGFPMQVLGFDVNMINSVQFSNHTGYPVVKGSVLGGPDLDALIDGLVVNDLSRFDYMLTGYIGSETFLTAVQRALHLLKQANPQLKYICDPVLGDGGRLYVPMPLIEIYRTQIMPKAYMITPNQMEAEYLSGMHPINTEDRALAALAALYRMGPRVVVLTSAELGEHPGKLCCYVVSEEDENVAADQEAERTRRRCSSGASTASSIVGSGSADGNDALDLDGPPTRLSVSRIIVNKLTDHHYTGTGDVTCALLLSWIHKLKVMQQKHGGGVVYGTALRNALATVQAMLRRAQRNYAAATATASSASQSPSRAARCRHVELPIVQSKGDIENPPVHLLRGHSSAGKDDGVAEVVTWSMLSNYGMDLLPTPPTHTLAQQGQRSRAPSLQQEASAASVLGTP